MVVDKKKTKEAAQAENAHKRKTCERLIDELLVDCKTPEDIIGDQGLIKKLTKAVIERALNSEMTAHLGYERHALAGHHSGNSRNGTSKKTLKGEFGEIDLNVPRDRNGTFEPLILPKHQTRFDGFDEKILSMYARGMSTRDITAHLEEIYGVEVSPALVSQVTEGVMEEVRAWQNRDLEPVYPIVYLDALRVKIRGENRQVNNHAVYLAIGVNMEGSKEVLGLWVAKEEGASFWQMVLTELANRGVQDIFVACVDGLKGFPQAIEAVFPNTKVQCCIVHLVRASLHLVSWKDRKQMAAALRAIYTAPTEQEAERRLEEFEQVWDSRYPAVSKIWRRAWPQVIPLFGFLADVRKVIYTTNAVESLNMSLRRVIKTRGGFPTEESAVKLLYLALRNAAAHWTMPVQNWKGALNALENLFPGRVPAWR